MSSQYRQPPGPMVFLRRRLLALGLLVALVFAVSAGSRWLLTTDKAAGVVSHGSTAVAGHGSRTAAAQGDVVDPKAGKPYSPAPDLSVIPPALTASGPDHLAPGSDPSVLPGPVLIADKLNDRLLIIDPRGRTLWQFPRPGDLSRRQSFRIPDDAFFTPNGRAIIATEEDEQVIRVIDIATHKIVYTYGTPGVSGSGPDQLNNPDDALMLPTGDILVPDIKNCRIAMISQGGHAITRQLGRTGQCLHHPPQTFGSPNGVFPLTDGNYLVTEINGSWVSEMSLSGGLSWSAQLPRVAYPSDSNQIGPDRYLTVDYSRPGQILTFDHTGHVLWRYAPTGDAALNKPSLALPLPNGDVLANDDANHRVIVVDPRTDRVLWQYGHTHVSGSTPGYLNNPDGLDLFPPHSLLITHAATMRTMGALPKP